MSFIARRVLLALFVLSVLAMSAAAQDAGVRVSGSGVAGQAWRSVVTDDSFVYEFTGTQNGTSALCANVADVVLTNRPLSSAEAAACTANSVEWSELLIGYDGYALVASPDVDFATCLTTTNLDMLVVPSLSGSETNWSELNSSYADLPFSFAYSGAASRSAALLDRVVRGEGFRNDATVLADDAAVIADVAAGSGKLGLVSLAAALDAEGVTVLDLHNTTLNNCITPSAENALNRQYQGGDRLFAYVNVNAFDEPGVTEALTALTGPDAAEALIAAGFVPATESLRERGAEVVAERTTGRVFSLDMNTYQVTGDTTGTLRVGGSSAGANYLKTALQSVVQRYGSITLEEHYLGAPEAIREFCNGSREIIALTAPLTDEQQENCDANEITAYEVDLGAHTAVLVGNSASEYLSCVSTALIGDVFGISGAAIDAWNDYDASFGEEPVYIFVSSLSDAAADLMLIKATGVSTPLRDDAQVNADAAYRAAAVANTPGAVALMTWADAQDALAKHDNLVLLSVQADGGECVAPSLETIADGSYPLSQTVKLVVNSRALRTDMVQATLYTLFADENYSQIENAGYVGIAFADLVSIRSTLVDAFRAADAEEAAEFAASLPEATAEPTSSTDVEATPEPADGE